jgi:hypothetical protein
MDYMYAIFIFLIVHWFWAGHGDYLLKCRSDPRCADQLVGLVYVSFTAHSGKVKTALYGKSI